MRFLFAWNKKCANIDLREESKRIASVCRSVLLQTNFQTTGVVKFITISNFHRVCDALFTFRATHSGFSLLSRNCLVNAMCMVHVAFVVDDIAKRNIKVTLSAKYRRRFYSHSFNRSLRTAKSGGCGVFCYLRLIRLWNRTACRGSSICEAERTLWFIFLFYGFLVSPKI